MEMRFYVKLDLEEYRALVKMARQDLREEREELRYLIREESIRRGWSFPVRIEERAWPLPLSECLKRESLKQESLTCTD